MSDLLSTGAPGLDHVLRGGLPAQRMYLLQGDPGVGKTTLALQFLREGAARGERCMYITFSETEQEIRAIAASHGWELEGIELYELSAAQQARGLAAESDLFHPSEMELQDVLKVLLAEVERLEPQRLVFDSLSELRLLAQETLRYRRQILTLKQYFAGKNCTVILLDDNTSAPGDQQLLSITHGVIHLSQVPSEYGSERRRLRVVKMRGVDFRGGYHDVRIRRGGVHVFPRLVAAESRGHVVANVKSSGNKGLDELLGGGPHQGTSTLIVGPAGCGKSTVALSFAVHAARRGEKASLFIFDEGLGTLMLRARACGLPLEEHLESGKISVRQIDPAELGPSEFACLVAEEITQTKASMVVIDSLNGYLHAMPEQQFLVLQMHELLSYLNQQGVTTLMVLAQAGLIGANMTAPIDISYLADAVIMMRYFEAGGAVRRAVSVLKKRTGAHEDTIREFNIGAGGITVGSALTGFQGVLSGTPLFVGASRELLGKDDGER